MRAFAILAVAALISAADAFAPARPLRLQSSPTVGVSTTSTSLREGNGFLDALGGIGATLQKEAGSIFNASPSSPKESAIPERPDLVIDPDYKLAAIFLAGGLVLDFIPYVQLLLGLPVTLLGILFLVQTTRIRFCFDGTSFELRTSSGGDDGELEKAGENIVVGGENRWAYDSFVNYAFFPEGWIDQPQGPILVYFKETQTPSDMWDEGPGKSANNPEAIAKGAVPGQVHFFPALCDCKQIREEFEKRGCAKL